MTGLTKNNLKMLTLLAPTFCCLSRSYLVGDDNGETELACDAHGISALHVTHWSVVHSGISNDQTRAQR